MAENSVSVGRPQEEAAELLLLCSLQLRWERWGRSPLPSLDLSTEVWKELRRLLLVVRVHPLHSGDFDLPASEEAGLLKEAIASWP